MTGPFGTTAGPWGINNDSRRGYIITAPDGDLVPWEVAIVQDSCGYDNGPENDTPFNARAIAQVPAMLELVERVMLTANNPSHDDPLDDIETLAAMARTIARELEEK